MWKHHLHKLPPPQTAEIQRRQIRQTSDKCSFWHFCFAVWNMRRTKSMPALQLPPAENEHLCNSWGPVSPPPNPPWKLIGAVSPGAWGISYWVETTFFCLPGGCRDIRGSFWFQTRPETLWQCTLSISGLIKLISLAAGEEKILPLTKCGNTEPEKGHSQVSGCPPRYRSLLQPAAAGDRFDRNTW